MPGAVLSSYDPSSYAFRQRQYVGMIMYYNWYQLDFRVNPSCPGGPPPS